MRGRAAAAIREPIPAWVRFGLLTVLAVLGVTGCGGDTIRFRTTVLHQDSRFDSNTFSSRSVVLFPVFSTAGFREIEALSPLRQIGMIRSRRTDLVLSTAERFDSLCRGECGRELEEIFYPALFSADPLALRQCDSVWARLPGRYALFTRITEAVGVKNLDGMLVRHVVLETELWDASTAQAVLRLQSEGFTTDDSVADVHLLQQTFHRLIEAMPRFRPSAHEEAW